MILLMSATLISIYTAQEDFITFVIIILSK
jgi:hypothetical protein